MISADMGASAGKRRVSRSAGPKGAQESRKAAAPTAPPDNGTDSAPQPLQIKKYANRRFYDATRSRHITLADMHRLIVEGAELRVMDASTGEDITNAILTQIILEQDPPKLEFFPAAVLHQVIRTQRQLLGGVMEQFFNQWLATQRASQERWINLLRGVFGSASPPLNPLAWTEQMLRTLTPGGLQDPTGASDSSELERLRAQVAALAQRMGDSQASQGR